MSDIIIFENISSLDIDLRHSSAEIYGGKRSLLRSNFQKLKYIVKNILNIFANILTTSYLLSTPQCMLREEIGKAHLVSALLAGAGISYILLEIFSTRLIISGASRLGYILCILILLNQEHQKCPGPGDIFAMGTDDRTNEWKFRLQTVQGAVIVTCLVQMLIGIIGVNNLIKYIRPVAIAPIMLLISIFVIKTTAVKMADTCWTLFFTTIFFMFLSYCSYHYFYANKNSISYKILIIRRKICIGVASVIIVWTLCLLLSSMGYIESKSPARTDMYTGIWNYASQFRFSYLFQWGKPKWEMDAISIILPASFISVFEILASYYNHLQSECKWNVWKEKRDKATWSSIILWEGAFCLLNATMGTALGIDISFKQDNQKFLGVFIGVILILIALSGKLCSLFVIIPEPIVSALIFLIFMSVFFEGLNLMRSINFRSRTNLYIIGSSLFLGFVIPAVIKDRISHVTGKPTFNCVLLCLLSTEFLVAGFVAIILDNLTRIFSSKKSVQSANEKFKQDDSKAEADEKDSMSFCECLVSFFV